MPAFPKFEDWTPPWGSDDSAFDAEKAKKRIYDLLKDKNSQSERITSLTTELDAEKQKVIAFEEKDLSEVDRLRKENERLKADPPKAGSTKGQGSDDADLKAARLEIALEKGLTLAQSKRLTGTTREELEADAEAYIEEHGLAGAGNGSGKENDGGKEGQAPPSNRVKVTTGTKQRGEVKDPDEDLDPGKLWDKAHGKDD